MYYWKMIHINIFLPFSKLFVILIRQTSKWRTLLRNSKNHTIMFPICVPTAHQKQFLCMHIGLWYYKHHILTCQGFKVSIRDKKYLYRKVQRTRATAQVTTLTKRTTVCLIVETNSRRNTSSGDLLWTPYPHHGIDCFLLKTLKTEGEENPGKELQAPWHQYS